MRNLTQGWLVVGLSLSLSVAGCGAEVAVTAATSAAVKQQEVDAAKQTRDRAQQQIDQAVQVLQQRAEQQDNAGK